VTEVARIDKKLIDCQRTFRTEETCRLKGWVAEDYDYRLSASKLIAILQKAAPILGTEDLTVDVEQDLGFVSQFPFGNIRVSGHELFVQLAGRNTACLKPEKGCPPQVEPAVVALGGKK
jgi:hypothetical protein